MTEETLRKIQSIPMTNLERAILKDNKPEFRWVSPTDLHVEPAYQRNVSERSITLIRKLVKNWDWSKVKPPICGESNNKLFVVDGQHTAIAAASHGKIPLIPIIVIPGLTLAQRADAFLGHNRDRLNITSMQLHYAAVQAGNPLSVAVHNAAIASGAQILKYPPQNGFFKSGSMICIGNATTIAKHHGEEGLTRALKILVKAKRAPISAPELKAVSRLLWDDKNVIIDESELTTIIRSKTVREWKLEAEEVRQEADGKMSLDRALVALWQEGLE